jgi:Tfp pilus assembly protein PilF
MLGQIFGLLTRPLRTERGRVVVGLLVVTGLVSITIGRVFGSAAWAFPAQVILVLVFITGAGFVYTPPEGRFRLVAALAPGVGAVLLGLFLLSDWLLILSGAGLGWFVAALFLFREQTPPEVMRSIRKMRRGEYKEAITEIDEVIKRDRDNPEHYRLRAMIFRLDGRLDRSKKDYEKMLSLAPEGQGGDGLRAEAYDGLAEVHVQAGRFEAAHETAMKAHELYPDNWVPLYNLGLINDRLEDSEAVVKYLTRAFEVKISDGRQRLLAHLYLARAHKRLGDMDAAKAEVETFSAMWKSLEQLEKLVSGEQSGPLAAVIAGDIKTAQGLMIDELDVTDL